MARLLTNEILYSLDHDDKFSRKAKVDGTFRHNALFEFVTTGNVNQKLSDRLADDKSFAHLRSKLNQLASSGQFKLVAAEYPLDFQMPELADSHGPLSQLAGSIDLILSEVCPDSERLRLHLLDYKSGKCPGLSLKSTVVKTVHTWIISLHKWFHSQKKLNFENFPEIPGSPFCASVLQVNFYSFMLRTHMAKEIISKDIEVFPKLWYGDMNSSHAQEVDLALNGLCISDDVIPVLFEMVMNSFLAIQQFCDQYGVARRLFDITWSFASERAEFQKCPEILAMDTVANVSREGRKGIELVAFSSNGKNCVPFQGLVLDQRRSTFNWILNVAVPALLCNQSLQCTSVFLTDECQQEISAFELAKARGVFNPACMRRSCIFHKINLGLKKTNFFKHLDESYKNAIRFHLALIWKSVQTKSQAIDVLNYLRVQIPPVISSSAAMKHEYLNFFDSLESSLSDWALFSVLGVRCLDRFTTSSVESEHSVLKRHLNAQSSLSDFFRVCHSVLSGRYRESLADQVNQANSANVDFDSIFEDETKRCLRNGERILTRYALNLLESQLKLAIQIQYTIRKGTSGSDVCWELINSKSKSRFAIVNDSEHDFDSERAHNTSIPAEKYDIEPNKRHVKLEKCSDSTTFLSCSCFWFQRNLIPCRHILAVKRFRFNAVKDIHFRWFQPVAYEKYGPSTGMRRSRDDGIVGPSTYGLLESNICDAMQIEFDAPDFDCDNNVGAELSTVAEKIINSGKSSGSTFSIRRAQIMPTIDDCLSLIDQYPVDVADSLMKGLQELVQDFKNSIIPSVGHHKKRTGLRTANYRHEQ